MRSRSDSLTAAGTLAFGLYAGGGALGMPAISGFMSRKPQPSLSLTLARTKKIHPILRKNNYFSAKEAANWERSTEHQHAWHVIWR